MAERHDLRVAVIRDYLTLIEEKARIDIASLLKRNKPISDIEARVSELDTHRKQVEWYLAWALEEQAKADGA